MADITLIYGDGSTPDEYNAAVNTDRSRGTKLHEVVGDATLNSYDRIVLDAKTFDLANVPLILPHTVSLSGAGQLLSRIKGNPQNADGSLVQPGNYSTVADLWIESIEWDDDVVGVGTLTDDGSGNITGSDAWTFGDEGLNFNDILIDNVTLEEATISNYIDETHVTVTPPLGTFSGHAFSIRKHIDFTLPVGIGPTQAGTGVRLERVGTTGDTDGPYIESTSALAWDTYDCTFESKWDAAVTLDRDGPNLAAHRVTHHNPTLVSDGTDVVLYDPDGQRFLSSVVAGSGITNILGGTSLVKNAPIVFGLPLFTTTNGLTANGSGVLNLYGHAITSTTDKAGQTAMCLSQSQSGIINVHAGNTLDTERTQGTITYNTDNHMAETLSPSSTIDSLTVPDVGVAASGGGSLHGAAQNDDGNLLTGTDADSSFLFGIDDLSVDAAIATLTVVLTDYAITVASPTTWFLDIADDEYFEEATGSPAVFVLATDTASGTTLRKTVSVSLTKATLDAKLGRIYLDGGDTGDEWEVDRIQIIAATAFTAGVASLDSQATTEATVTSGDATGGTGVGNTYLWQKSGVNYDTPTYATATLTDLSGTITDLAPNRRTKLRVRFTDTGQGPTQNIFGSPITVDTTPAAPTSLLATAASGSRIDLTWSNTLSDNTTPVNIYTGVLIEKSLAGEDSWTTVATAAGSAESYSVTGLSFETEYDFRVSGVNDAGTSTPSDLDTAETLVAPTGTGGSNPPSRLGFGHGF